MKPLLIVLGILFLIGCIPISLRFSLRDGVDLKLVIAFWKLWIVPKKPLSRKKREKKEAKKAEKEAKKAEAKEKKKKKQKSEHLIAKPSAQKAAPKRKKSLPDKVAALIPWARLAARFAGEFFRRKLTVTRLRIRIVLAGSDPAKTALTVGKAWETVGIALPILERAFRIRERKIAVYPDFLAQKTEVEAELRIRVFFGGVVLLALKYGCKALALLLRRKCDARRQKKAKPAEKEEPQSTEQSERVVS